MSSLPPSTQQVLFARAVIHTFRLWASLQLAIQSEWGGPESQDKADFLVSHICDTYGGISGATTLRPDLEPTTAHLNPAGGAGSSSALALPPRPAPPASPDEDDLAQTLETYVSDEFDARFEDDSCDYVAQRIAGLHRVIFAKPEPGQDPVEAAQAIIVRAQAAVAPLDEAVEKFKGKKLEATQQAAADEDGEDDSGEESDEQMMEVDAAAAGQSASSSSRPEPEVDEDGFTTVVRGKKR